MACRQMTQSLPGYGSSSSSSMGLTFAPPLIKGERKQQEFVVEQKQYKSLTVIKQWQRIFFVYSIDICSYRKSSR